jgi:twitching motility two-component system response regulator PilG
VSTVSPFQLLKDGIAAARAGNKVLTRQLLAEVTHLEPRNETAWLWLAGVAESPREALGHLRRVLEINPGSERARSALKTVRVEAGIAAAQAQEKAEARALLGEAVAEDPGNETAWLWLAGVAESPADAVACLERVLGINPANERARRGIDWYRSQTKPVAPAWGCPLCQAQAAAECDPCPACGATLSLADPEDFAAQQAVDPHKMAAAVDRLAAVPRGQARFGTFYHLGLALLNQKQFAPAAAEFQKALRLEPGQNGLRAYLDALLRYVDAQAAAAQERAEQERASRKTILVVDDSPTIRKLVTLALERRGYQVVASEDGYKAVDQIRQHGAPHLILLDITMPGMDGYQLCKLLRQNRETAHLPIIMLSGKDGFFSKVRGRMAGSTEYLTKPFQPEGLAQVVEKYCPRKPLPQSPAPPAP